MALHSLKLPVAPTPATEKCAYVGRQRQTTAASPSQVKCKLVQDTPQPSLVSRRDAMILSSSLATTLFASTPAEARIIHPDIRQKIMEKLQMLREKVGLSKKEEPNPPPTEEKAQLSTQFMERIEILKEKVGLSKREETPGLSKREEAPAAAEEISSPTTQIMEKIEMLKEKAALLKKEKSSGNAGNTQAALQNSKATGSTLEADL